LALGAWGPENESQGQHYWSASVRNSLFFSTPCFSGVRANKTGGKTFPHGVSSASAPPCDVLGGGLTVADGGGSSGLELDV